MITPNIPFEPFITDVSSHTCAGVTLFRTLVFDLIVVLPDCVIYIYIYIYFEDLLCIGRQIWVVGCVVVCRTPSATPPIPNCGRWSPQFVVSECHKENFTTTTALPYSLFDLSWFCCCCYIYIKEWMLHLAAVVCDVTSLCQIFYCYLSV